MSMIDRAIKQEPEIKFHQVFYVCVMVTVLLYHLGTSSSVAYALGATTFDALWLAAVIFGLVWVDSKLFRKNSA